MSSLARCLKLAGKALSKNDASTLKDTRQRYIAEGMDQKDATLQAVEDFINTLDTTVSGYETEIAAKGGVTDAEAFNLAQEIADAKGIPLVVAPETPSDKSSTTLYSLEDQGYTPEQQDFIDTGDFGKGGQKQNFNDRFNEMRAGFKTKLRQKTVDQYASFKDILKNSASWMLSHVSHSVPGALESIITIGQPFMSKEGIVQVDSNQKSLNKVTEPLGKLLDQWTYWMAANRAHKLMKEGREHRFTQPQIDAGRTLNEKHKELFEQARKDFAQLEHAVVKMGVDTGVFNKEETERWKEDAFYLPFYRVLQEGEVRGPRGITNMGLVGQQAVKMLKGGTAPLGNLMVNVMMNWEHIISASLKNQAGRAALAQAEALGLATLVNKKLKSKEAVYIRKNGEEVWYEVSEPLVLESLLALNWEGLNSRAMDVARKFKRALTIGVTASPEFKIKNLLRDTIHALAVTTISLDIGKNLTEGWKATVKGSVIAAQMLAGGASFGQSGYIHGSDPEAGARLAKQVLNKKLAEANLLDVNIIDTPAKLKKIWDAYQDFGARLENINRAADYVQSIARGDDLLTATFNARDHLDFTRTGTMTSVRFIAQLSPFVNARLQGIDKLARAAPGTMKEWLDPREAIRFKAVVGVYSAMSIALYLAMKDDEDYKALEEWEQRTYHHFKMPDNETMFRIPRPFEVGAIAYLAESLAKVMIEDETHGVLFAERLGHTITDTLAFNPLPQIFNPALEIAVNKNFFTGKPIESPYARLSGMSPSQIRKAWTSETAIGIAAGFEKINWTKVKLSPIQVEHLVKGYLGWMGAMGMAGVDMLITRPITGAPSQPATKWTEYPGIKALVKTMPPRSTRYTTEFYEQLNKLNAAFMDIRDARKYKNIERELDTLKEHKNLTQLRRFYSIQNKELQKISERIKITHLSTMTAKNKRTEIDRLTVMKNRLTKLTSERVAEFKKSKQ